MKRRVFMLATALFAALPAQARDVTDLAGRAVEVPDRVAHIACLEVLCYPTLFMLGAADRIAIMYATAAPWMEATNPAVAAIPRLTGDADVEELLALKTDVAFFFYNFARMGGNLATVGLPAVVSQPIGRPPQTADAYAGAMKATVRLYGGILGDEARQRAEDWCAYFDQKRALVAARVAGLAPSERRKLYYLRGPQAQSGQRRYDSVYWLGEIAGAEMVALPSAQAGPGVLALEYIFAENPDVIIVGRQYPTSLVLGDPRWASVRAVSRGAVYPSPAGVSYWDGGPESVLMMLFIAHTLYPALFADIDMTAEIRAYYARFYHVAIDEAAAGKILAGQWPDGRRFNPINN